MCKIAATRGGRRPPPSDTEDRPGGPLPLGGGQSIMFDIGFGNTCQIKKVLEPA